MKGASQPKDSNGLKCPSRSPFDLSAQSSPFFRTPVFGLLSQSMF